MFEFDFLAVVDGGSKGNGSANKGYGSYCLATSHVKVQTVRINIGITTNNA